MSMHVEMFAFGFFSLASPVSDTHITTIYRSMLVIKYGFMRMNVPIYIRLKRSQLRNS